jgi:hypothetical protein
VSTSFLTSAKKHQQQKQQQPKVNICIDRVPVFNEPSKETAGEDIFFVTQPSPICGDDAHLIAGDRSSSLMSPSVAGTPSTGKETTMAKGMLGLHLKGLLNRPSKQQHDDLKKEINPDFPLAIAPSIDSLDTYNTGVDSSNANSSTVISQAHTSCSGYSRKSKKGVSKGQVFVAKPATTMMGSYPQLSVHTPSQVVSGSGSGPLPLSSSLIVTDGGPMDTKSANSGDMESISSNTTPERGGGAKKAKNLLRRIKGRSKMMSRRSITNFGSLNDDDTSLE